MHKGGPHSSGQVLLNFQNSKGGLQGFLVGANEQQTISKYTLSFLAWNLPEFPFAVSNRT